MTTENKLVYQLDKIKLPDSKKLDDLLSDLQEFVSHNDQLRNEIKASVELGKVDKTEQPKTLAELKKLLNKKPEKQVLSVTEASEKLELINNFLLQVAPSKVSEIQKEYYAYKKAVHDLWNKYMAQVNLNNIDESIVVCDFLRSSVNNKAFLLEDIAEVLNADFNRYNRINCFVAISKLHLSKTEFLEVLGSANY